MTSLSMHQEVGQGLEWMGRTHWQYQLTTAHVHDAWLLWQVFLCCCSKWGACFFSLSRLVCVLSQKKVLFPFLPFLPILFYGGPLYFTCLA